MNTLMAYTNFEELSKFYWLEGDFSNFDGVVINTIPEPDTNNNQVAQLELVKFLFRDEPDEDGEYERQPSFTSNEVSNFVKQAIAEGREVKIISCGFVP